MKYKLREGVSIDEFHIIESFLQSKGVQDVKRYLKAGANEILPCALLDNLEKGAEMLREHMLNEHKISIVVDDDCDGFLSAALVYKTLVEIYEYKTKLLSLVFHKAKKKVHGLQLEELPEDSQLIIIPDAGTSDYRQWEILKSRGTDILILDHHEADDPERKASNVVLINNQLSPNYPNKQLCGTGVTYKFLQYFLGGEKDKIAKWIDLVAIATISDMMSLIEMENRAILNIGLKNIDNKFFKMLIEEKEKSPFFKFSPQAISFFIIPPINAIIRLNEDKGKENLFHAIVTPDKIVPCTKRGAAEGETETIAEQVVRTCANAVSKQRRERSSLYNMVNERVVIEDQCKNAIIIGKLFEEDDCNRSLTGLTAANLASSYGRPALVLKYDEDSDTWAGSARNFGTLIPDLKEFLLSSGLLVSAQGHPNSFGITVAEKNLNALVEYCNKAFQDVDFRKDSETEVEFIITPFDSFLLRTIKELEENSWLWGAQVEEPKICVEGIVLQRQEVAQLGANADGVRFKKNGIEYIKFKDLDMFNDLTRYPVTGVTVIGRANVNHWGGNAIPQIIITDYETDDGGGF